MKQFSVRGFFRSRFPLAILAGVLLACSFPKPGVAGFAWIAPGLMLAAALGKRPRESFSIGYVAGLAHYLASLYWLLFIPVKGFPILGWLALSGFLALLPGTWVWACFKVLGFGSLVSGSEEPLSGHPGLQETKPADYLPRTWGQRAAWATFCAMAWVALEMLIARLFGGFPWNLLGDSQYRIIPLIQVASVTGVYGVSFILVWTSVSLLCAGVTIIRKANRESHTSPLFSAHATWAGEVILPLLAVIAIFGYGFHRIIHAPPDAREVRLTFVQPSIPQTLIWDSANDLRRFQDIIALSESALSNDTDVLLWPEAAMPGLPRYEANIGGPISALAQRHKVWMIVGADDMDQTQKATNFFNAAFLVDPNGRLAETYRKRSLVMFGEYIPLTRWLPFIKWFTPITDSYTAGDRAVQFRMNFVTKDTATGLVRISPDGKAGGSDETTREATCSVLICFEDTFPQLGRSSTAPGTDFLVNITNDGWFGESAAQWQHTAAATFRAVENGVPLVRCANTGLTCWIDANGRWRDLFRNGNGSVYGAGYLTATLPLPASGLRVPTFYNLHGDWFGWCCTSLFAGGLIMKRFAN